MSEISEVSVMTLNDLQDRGDKFLLIDVRTEREFLTGHLEGALWIPRGKLEFAIGEVAGNPQQKIVLYCRSGGRGALATRTLAEMGYGNAHNLSGGFKAWVEQGHSQASEIRP